MKQIKIDDLIFCPLCGAAPIMLSNSSHRFCIQCSRCNARTDWTTKADAVVKWYNLHHTLQASRFLRTNPQVRIYDGAL